MNEFCIELFANFPVKYQMAVFKLIKNIIKAIKNDTIITSMYVLEDAKVFSKSLESCPAFRVCV